MKHYCKICYKVFDEEDGIQLDEEFWLCEQCKKDFEADLMDGLNQMAVRYDDDRVQDSP